MGRKLKRREELLSTLFVRTAAFGDLGSHVVLAKLAVWPLGRASSPNTSFYRIHASYPSIMSSFAFKEASARYILNSQWNVRTVWSLPSAKVAATQATVRLIKSRERRIRYWSDFSPSITEPFSVQLKCGDKKIMNANLKQISCVVLVFLGLWLPFFSPWLVLLFDLYLYLHLPTSNSCQLSCIK